MRKNLAVFFLMMVFSSCFLFKDYRKKEFSYSNNGQTAVLPIIVPKGYVKEEKADSAGVRVHSFHYNGGAILYTAYLTDTSVQLHPINQVLHQPLVHRLGGTVYKGQDENHLYYREIRQGPFRFGYRYVSGIFELQFDSATNHASLQKK